MSFFKKPLTDNETIDPHPNRQGTRPEEDYQMQHDIYSLGVILLELGLWQSFITYLPVPTSDLSLDPPCPTSHAKFPDAILSAPIPPPFILNNAAENDTRKRAHAIKSHLISLAASDLPAKMGEKYTNIVLLCLRCLDKEKDNTAEVAEGGEEEGIGEFRDVLDEDGIIVGVKYIEKVLLKMQEISI